MKGLRLMVVVGLLGAGSSARAADANLWLAFKNNTLATGGASGLVGRLVGSTAHAEGGLTRRQSAHLGGAVGVGFAVLSNWQKPPVEKAKAILAAVVTYVTSFKLVPVKDDAQVRAERASKRFMTQIGRSAPL